MAKKADLEIDNIVDAEEKHIVSVRYTAYAYNTSKSTNLAIASFTTSHARFKLYNLLESLQQKVLYCDTDSCIFEANDGDHIPVNDRFLGDLTDEIGQGTVADSFVFTGPKPFAVRLRKADGEIDHILKAKGLTLNRKTKEIVNFENMLRIVLDKIEKDFDEKEREWLMGDDKFYEMLKDKDGKVIEVKQI